MAAQASVFRVMVSREQARPQASAALVARQAKEFFLLAVAGRARPSTSSASLEITTEAAAQAAAETTVSILRVLPAGYVFASSRQWLMRA